MFFSDRGRLRKLLGRVLFAGLVLSLGGGARDAVAGYTFDTPSNSTAGGQPVDATATFNISAGMIQVVITNNEVNPQSDIQTINGVSFTLSSGQTAGSISSSVGSLIDIGGDGSVTPVGGDPGWNYHQAGLGVEITSIGNSAASPTIIGSADSSGDYSNGNGSITNGAHNPFVQQTATFNLSIPNLPSTASISAMRFEFGTSSGTNVTGDPQSEQPFTPTAVPEPASAIMLGIGLGSIAFVGLRRRRSRPSAS